MCALARTVIGPDWVLASFYFLRHATVSVVVCLPGLRTDQMRVEWANGILGRRTDTKHDHLPACEQFMSFATAVGLITFALAAPLGVGLCALLDDETAWAALPAAAFGLGLGGYLLCCVRELPIAPRFFLTCTDTEGYIIRFIERQHLKRPHRDPRPEEVGLYAGSGHLLYGCHQGCGRLQRRQCLLIAFTDDHYRFMDALRGKVRGSAALARSCPLSPLSALAASRHTHSLTRSLTHTRANDDCNRCWFMAASVGQPIDEFDPIDAFAGDRVQVRVRVGARG